MFLTMTVMEAPGSIIGSLWRKRMDSLQEYEVVRDGNVFASGFTNSFVYSSEYDRARTCLKELLDRYDGCSVETVFSHGREMTNDGGTCFLLESCEDLDSPVFDKDRFLNALHGDLTLVHGIGRSTEKRLKVRGYRTLYDLMEHPRYRAYARRAAECFGPGKTADIMEFIGKRHSKSHPFVLGTAGFHEPGDYVFLDIETLGLFSRPIILFGAGFLRNGKLVIRQYLLRDISEEPAALMAATGHLSRDHQALITFNGKAFDAPYISDRLCYYGMDALAGIPHFDVLHFSRRKWKHTFPSLRLCTLEKEILGIGRSDDVPGQMVPEFYETYLRTGNCGPLVPIVEHNRQDVASLARLFFRLLGDVCGDS
jgi:uncharacterized protein YprB with RNaseH-like and TPR domain